jgi:hypothetical protein
MALAHCILGKFLAIAFPRMQNVGAKILTISNCNLSTEKTSLDRLVITTLHTVRYTVNCTTGPWK